MLSKIQMKRAVYLAALFILFGCGSGDDDGRRLGEYIVGTWQRGWGEGDIIIEGNDQLKPEDFPFDRFEFHDDGTYNGMVREGSFSIYDTNGDLLYEGDYQCNNRNIRFTSSSVEGVLLLQVVSFTEQTIIVRYTVDVNVTATITIRKT